MHTPTSTELGDRARPRPSAAHSGAAADKTGGELHQIHDRHLLGAAVRSRRSSAYSRSRPGGAADHQPGYRARLRSRLRSQHARQMRLEYVLSNSLDSGGTTARSFPPTLSPCGSSRVRTPIRDCSRAAHPRRPGASGRPLRRAPMIPASACGSIPSVDCRAPFAARTAS